METVSPPQTLQFESDAAKGKFLSSGAEAIFEATDARSWIEAVRVPREGPLNVTETLRNLGLTVGISDLDVDEGDLHIRKIQGELLPPTSERAGHIRLSRSLRADEVRVTTGHELGHYFLECERGLWSQIEDERIENFCEYFGHEIALPAKVLEHVGHIDEVTIVELAQAYGISIGEVISQMQLHAYLPKRVAIEVLHVATDTGHMEMVRDYACLDCRYRGVCDPHEKGHQTHAFNFGELALSNETGCLYMRPRRKNVPLVETEQKRQ